jgi:hypothetical protein
MEPPWNAVERLSGAGRISRVRLDEPPRRLAADAVALVTSVEVLCPHRCFTVFRIW